MIESQSSGAPDLPCKAAMVLVCVSKNDPANIGNPNSMLAEFATQGVRGLRRFRPDIYQRNGILFYEIDVYVADIERRGN